MQTLKKLNGPVEAILEPYKVVAEGMVSVCSCCFPGNSIVELFPDLEGMQISHGICARHARRWTDELYLQRMSKDLRPLNTAYWRMGGAL